MKLLHSVSLLATASAALFAQAQYLEPTARLPKGLAREDCNLTLFLDGSDIPIACRMTDFYADAATFQCHLTGSARLARFVFVMPGYKPFTLNAPLVRPANGSSQFLAMNLGELQPIPSDDPRIDSIVLSRRSDGAMRFQLVVNNPSTNEVVVTGIGLSGTQESNCGIGKYPPVYFELSRQLLLAPGRSGRNSISGALAETSDHPEFRYQVTGAGVFDACGTSEFTLSAPATVTLLPGHSEIDLVIPPTPARVTDWNRTVNSSRTSPVGAPAAAVVDIFDRIRFTLVTSDHREVKSYYDKQ